MDSDWYFRMPEFQDHSKWIEVMPYDFYFDPKTVTVREDRNYGCGPKDMILGMAICKRSAEDPDLMLMEYRTVDGKGPFVLKWWDKNRIGRFGHAIKVDGVWHVKGEGQVVFWKVVYDHIKKRTKSVTVTLETPLSPPEN